MKNNIFSQVKKAVAIFVLSLSPVFAFAAPSNEELVKRLNEMEARLAEVEIQSSLDTFKWSGVLINRFDLLDNKYGDPEQKDLLQTYSTLVALNLDVQMSDKVSFYSTIGMSKFWNNDGRSERQMPWDKSMTGSYQMNGATPMIDRAYMSYRFDMPLTFSIGRMSTNMGPPIEQLDGVARLGTYPRFAYNAIFDGAALSYDFASLMPTSHSLRMSFFYTPFVNIDAADRTKQMQVAGERIDSSNQQYTLLTEYQVSDMSWLRKLSLTHFIYDYRGFYWDGLGYYDGTANAGFIGFEGIGNTGLNVSVSLLNVYSGITGASKNTSNASLVNANYQFSSLGNLIVGGEYIKTDEAFYLDEWTYTNLIPFYKTANAAGVHAYVSKSLGNSITARVGYYKLDADASALAGTPKANMVSYYGNLRFDF